MSICRYIEHHGWTDRLHFTAPRCHTYLRNAKRSNGWSSIREHWKLFQIQNWRNTTRTRYLYSPLATVLRLQIDLKCGTIQLKTLVWKYLIGICEKTALGIPNGVWQRVHWMIELRVILIWKRQRNQTTHIHFLYLLNMAPFTPGKGLSCNH